MGVKFAYYKRLGIRQRRTYDESDRVTSVRVPDPADLLPAAQRLRAALAADDRSATAGAAQALVDLLLRRLRVDPVEVKVLAVRPSSSREELHGLYEYGGKRKVPQISVWMRTAQRRQVVAFRTFLRTLLHEVVHHLDYRMLRLADSYHTQGFYKRAESLYRQVAPANEARPEAKERVAAAGRSAPAAPAAPTSRPPPRAPRARRGRTPPIPPDAAPAPPRVRRTRRHAVAQPTLFDLDS